VTDAQRIAATQAGTFNNVAGPDGKIYQVSSADLRAGRLPWLQPGAAAAAPNVGAPGAGAPSVGAGAPGVQPRPLAFRPDLPAAPSAGAPSTQPPQPSQLPWQSTAMPTGAFADPTTHQAQVKEITGAQGAANEAAQMQLLLGQAATAAKAWSDAAGPKTGPLAQRWLDGLRGLDNLGLLSPAQQAKVANGELVKMDANSIATAMAKQLGGQGRLTVSVFNAVQQAKPSILTSHPELAFSALNQDAQRVRDFAGFAQQYYQQTGNASKLDAQDAFNQVAPPAMYASRVLPLSLPPRNNVRPGFVYQTARGPMMARADGRFVPYQAQ
jgi:hypothetical protein